MGEATAPADAPVETDVAKEISAEAEAEEGLDATDAQPGDPGLEATA